MSHTPGPWFVDGTRSGYSIRSEGRGVAQIGWISVQARPNESLSNARLLAAAPDLLSALETLLSITALTTFHMTPDERNKWREISILAAKIRKGLL